MPPAEAGGAGRGWLLAIDTATSRVVVAAATPSGEVLATRSFPAEHRHGSHLLPAIESLSSEDGRALADLRGVIVGLGPGAFTGLRVGLATAKTLAKALDRPIVGVSTAEALLATHGGGVLLLPAGPHDRVVVAPGAAPRLEAGDAAAETADAIAVDLPGRASARALQRGEAAVAGLAAALGRIGAARLTAGDVDDVERLVPVYVSLPRGVRSEVGEEGVAWSRDPR
jgi:tRNA threonylcarbamoyl adenosine modification protein YeaZ